MVNILNHKNWILLPLLSAGFVLAILICTSHAALLKDIRVGEYSGFTRIVFELDTPAVPEKIELQPTKRLAVIFANTSADLIRKIPVERSPHVNNIQVWEEGNRLTALLAFDFDSFRHKSFSLIDPPRLVLDIHPTTNAPDASTASPPAITPDSESGFSQTASTRGPEPTPQREGEAFSGESASRIQEPPLYEARNSPLSVNETDQTVPDDKPANAPVASKTGEPPQTEPAPQTPGMVNHSEKTSNSSVTLPKYTDQPSTTRTGRLQFYLVIALVSITIIILVLLLLMLLVRHRWIDDRARLVAKEDAQESPKKI
jgi:hypothetical protein